MRDILWALRVIPAILPWFLVFFAGSCGATGHFWVTGALLLVALIVKVAWEI